MHFNSILALAVRPWRDHAPVVFAPLACARPWRARAPGLSRAPPPTGTKTGPYFDVTGVSSLPHGKAPHPVKPLTRSSPSPGQAPRGVKPLVQGLASHMGVPRNPTCETPLDMVKRLK